MADGQEMWSRWCRLIEEPEPDEMAIAAMATAFGHYFDEVKTRAVRTARQNGRSWEDVAHAVGTSKQSAWEKYRYQERERRRLSALLAVESES